MAQDVDYDFSAAASLGRALIQLHDKLDAFRDTARQALHDKLLNDCWQGAARVRFERDFERQQKALGHLADRARRLHGLVHDATDEARQAQRSQSTR
jgi:hypothetical protein